MKSFIIKRAKFGRSEAGSVANYGGNEKVRKHGDKAKAMQPTMPSSRWMSIRVQLL
jgi:hypothetical protein